MIDVKVNKQMLTVVVTAIVAWVYYLTKVEIPKSLVDITIPALLILLTTIAGFMKPKK